MPKPVVVPSAADRLQPGSGLLQLRHGQPALAVPRVGRAGGRHRRLQRLCRQDPHPLQRLARARPGRRRALRLLHGQRPPDGWRRRAQHAARLRPQHPDHHADPGGWRRTAGDRRHPGQPRGGVRQDRQQAQASSRSRRSRSSSRRPTTTAPTTTPSRRTPASTSRSPTRRRPSSRSTWTAFWQPRRSRCRLQMKAMHDEMGGVYDTQFGRMSGMLGLSLLNSPNHVLVPYGLASPPTDLVKGSLEDAAHRRHARRDPDLADLPQRRGHPHHPHAPVPRAAHQPRRPGRAWYGGIAAVDPTDLGWKDTFKVNPLEVTYLAMRPTVPTPDAAAVRGAQQRAPDRPDAAGGGDADPAAAGGLVRPEWGRDRRDPQPQSQLRLGVRVALPHPLARRDGHDALAGVRGAAEGAHRL